MPAAAPAAVLPPPACLPQVGGYTVLEVSVDLQVVQVMEGLTEDAVYARLHEGGCHVAAAGVAVVLCGRVQG